jgi:hypothetical protein
MSMSRWVQQDPMRTKESSVRPVVSGLLAGSGGGRDGSRDGRRRSAGLKHEARLAREVLGGKQKKGTVKKRRVNVSNDLNKTKIRTKVSLL